jgi:hypothetical protein
MVSRCVDDFAVTRKVPSYDTYQDSDLIDILDLLLSSQHFAPFLNSDPFHLSTPFICHDRVGCLAVDLTPSCVCCLFSALLSFLFLT